jgi:hypothetical protein
MKTFQRDVMKKRWRYGSGAARKQMQDQKMVDTTMTMVKIRERRNKTG